MPTEKIGILLTSKESGEQVAVIEFDPSGMLINQIIKPGLHVFALRSAMTLLPEFINSPHHLSSA
jgi:hypothetical protein